MEQGVFRQVTGFDISLARVNAGNAAYQALYGANAAQKIWLEHKGVNSEPYGEALYDVVSPNHRCTTSRIWSMLLDR